MKWFKNLMSTNKGRIFWLVFMVVVGFMPIPQNYYFVVLILEIALAWIGIDHLSNRLNIKHKKIWRIMAVFFTVFTYLMFLIVKRKQLKASL